ncbi:MAG: prolyl oligopeptidase family serine peptidase [Planctomycetota bacterium]
MPPKRRRPITAEDLLKITFVATPRISPDGEHIAFVRKHVGDKNDYVTNLWMVPSDGSAEAMQFTAGGRDSAPRWSPDGERLAFVRAAEKASPQLWTIPGNGGEATRLTNLPEGSLGAWRWSPCGTWIAAAFREQDPQWTTKAVADRKQTGASDPPRVLDHWWYRLDGDGYFNGQRHALYRIEAATGEHRLLYDKDTLGFFTFDVAPDGRHVMVTTETSKRAGLDDCDERLVRIDARSGKATPLKGLPKGCKSNVCYSPDGTMLAWAGRIGPDSTYSTENLELWVSNADGSKARSLTGKTDFCLLAAALSDTSEVAFEAGIQWTPDSKRLVIQLGWHGESHVASIARRGGEITFHTTGKRMCAGGNIARDGRMPLLVATPTAPEEVNVGTLQRGTMTPEALTSFNKPLLRELDLAKPRAHWIRSADGNKVHVWCMRPAGASQRTKRPAVLQIHGGPHAQYGYGFFHEFQLLAAQGYVVFYSNPRGSKGYGRDHCHAIRGTWGGADWVDMQAVIGFMHEQPGVKTDRMGVMGGSYGGYMTNWIIGHTREFAGAITDRCVSNLVSMFGSSDFIGSEDHYWDGNAWDRPEALWESSPIRCMGSAKTPTLIIHSEGDLRCNVEQAEQVHALLTNKKVPCRFVRYPASTSHGLSRGGAPDLRLHRLHEIVAWWERWLKK